MKKKYKKFKIPVWRILLGGLVTAVSFYLLIGGEWISPSLVSGVPAFLLLLLGVFSFIFIFSPLFACYISSPIAIIGLTWLLPTQWLCVLIFTVGMLGITYFDESGMRDWLEDQYLKSHISNILPKMQKAIKTKKHKRKGDKRIQLYKTLTLFSLLFSMLFPFTRIVTSGLVVLLPLFAVVRYFRFPYDISLGSKDKNELSPLAITILIPSTLMLIWNIHNQQYVQIFWMECGLFAFLWIVLFFIFSREYLKKPLVAVGFIFCMILFAFGAVSNVNRDYDNQPPEIFPVSVTEKHISGGKSKTCYITVTPWRAGQKETEVEVDKDVYRDAEIGDSVYILQFDGALGIPWYYLDTEDPETE